MTAPLSAARSRVEKPLPQYWVCTALFLMTFGPRFFGVMYLDTISAVTVLFSIWGVAFRRTPELWHRELHVLWQLFGVLIAFSVVSWVLNGFASNFYVLRNLRAFLNALGIAVLCLEVLRREPERGRDILYAALFWAIVAHGVIMVVQYMSPAARDLIYDISGYGRGKSTRVTGLTISYNTLNLTMGSGLLVFAAYQRGRSAANWLWIAGAVVVGTAMTMAGRAGLFVTVAMIGAAVVLLGNARVMVRAGSIAVFAFLLLTVAPRFLPTELADRYVFHTIHFITQPVVEHLEGGSVRDTHAGSTAEGVFANMYFLPEDKFTLIFGNTESGRDDVYITSDVGYVLHLFGMGMIGVGLMSSIYAYAAWIALRCWRVDRTTAMLLLLFVISTLLLNAKEQVMLTRHGLSVLTLYFSLAFWALNRARQSPAPAHPGQGLRGRVARGAQPASRN